MDSDISSSSERDDFIFESKKKTKNEKKKVTFGRYPISVTSNDVTLVYKGIVTQTKVKCSSGCELNPFVNTFSKKTL